VEAKENVRIQEESRTMATITFQNLFRIYKKLGGMTGTAETEAQEFSSTYKLDVNVIPTNRNMVREDHQDVVYKTEREKFTAAIREILDEHEKGRPVLVGTTSVEKSTAISRILKKKNVPHHVLNAKHHENEAFVVAQAGRRGAITVSTNMAGRGTDIMLGGNPEMLARWEMLQGGKSHETHPEEFVEELARLEKSCKAEHDEVIELGGLHILGTERHESRRIDNQLRGRAGRQGDPGSSRFYLSLEDDLMRIFAGDRVKNLMDRMGMPDDEPIEHPWVTKSIENAQRKVEERNFDIRKHLLEYDDVMNAQRKTVYTLRQQLLQGRYTPDELDELGKPTGSIRQIPVDETIRERVTPLIAQLVGMYSNPIVSPRDETGRSRAPTRAELEQSNSVAEPEQLRREVYHLWGISLDADRRNHPPPAEIYDELLDLVCRGLSEQRERMFDLIDRVVAAMVEECCPASRPPEDWDQGSIRDGFRECFNLKLETAVDRLGEPHRVVRHLYQQAEVVYWEREKEMGVDLALRVFRYVYLETIDEAWVDHLTNMEHLRDGIGLRGYGQRDPKNEYKKEGYNLFINMMARVSGAALNKFFNVQIQRQDEMQELEAAAEARHHAELDMAVAKHLGDEGEVSPEELLAQVRSAVNSVPQTRPAQRSTPRIGRNDPCPCGSGKKFKQCHGSSDDETAEAEP